MRADFVFVHGFTQTAGVVGPGHATLLSTTDAQSLAVPGGRRLHRDARAALDVGTRRTYVGYSQGGRLCLQLALDRPEVGRATRAGERVAGHRRRAERAARRRRRRAPRPGDRARRRRRVPRTLARATAVRDAAARARGHRRAAGREHRRVADVTSCASSGQGVAAVELGPARRAADAGAADRRASSTPSTSTSRTRMADAIPTRAGRGGRRRRATRATSSSRSVVAHLLARPGSAPSSSASGATVRTGEHAVDRDQRRRASRRPASATSVARPHA